MRPGHARSLWRKSGCVVTAIMCMLTARPARLCAEPTTYLIDPSASVLKFKGRSTLHRFTGTTTDVSGRIVFDPEHHILRAPGEVLVPIHSLDTGIEARNRAMQQMFEADQFPDIRFQLLRLSPLGEARGAAQRYHLEGTLTIRAIEQPVAFDVQARVSPETLEVSGQAALTTTAFDLKPPTVIGLIRVSSAVLVEFTIRWRRAP